VLYLSILFFLSVRGLNVICKKAPACRFKKVAFTPWSMCESNIKCPFLSAFEPRNYFFGRDDKAKRAGQIIGRAERQHA